MCEFFPNSHRLDIFPGNGKHKTIQETGTPYSHEDLNSQVLRAPLKDPLLMHTQIQHNLEEVKEKMTSCIHLHLNKPF